jgi:hypothetical protein
MPDPKDNNTNTTNSNSTDESTAGDILEQLKADSASTANLYKLEMKMFKTVTNMNKTMTKEYKLFTQAKKNLDTVTTTLTAVSKDVGSIRSTVSSVDTSLKQIYQVLGQISSNGSALGGGSSNSGSGVNGAAGNTAVRDLEQRIRTAEARLEQLRDDAANGLASQDDVDDQQQEVDELTSRLEDVRNSLRDVLGIYDDYETRSDLYERQIDELIQAYTDNQISLNELNQGLADARSSFDRYNDTLQEVERAWNSDGSPIGSLRAMREEASNRYDAERNELTEMFNRQVPGADGSIMTEDDYLEQMGNLIESRNAELAFYDNLIKSVKKVEGLVNTIAEGKTFDAKTGQNHTASAVVGGIGSIGGDLLGTAAGQAIGEAIGGPIGGIVGEAIGKFIGSKIDALATIVGDHLDYLANHSKKTRDEILKAGFDKIRSDVKDMATYSIEMYETASKNIYAAWDKNLSQITATQGYTKEALNSLQDAVAQRLQEEGYGTTIDASQYLDQLANTLNAKLGGQLAEAFAAQNLILQKAVPEVDLSQSAAEFAAIYAQANKESGTGEEEMIAAMNEIAGAAKALESVTEGNNQFLKETSTLMTRATEVVNIAGGNADQISKLTTQMMASEAAITSVAPQLSGFTNELVNILMNSNDATAVALRAIMNDINPNIGVSATSFMQSFMEDTQDTLSTAFAAIQRFIDQNENEASRQEFLKAMESIFGVQGSKLAQIDFGNVSDLIAQVSTSVNMAALTDAENLVRSGETTTLEEQLVANTANQLLATNALSSTIDNKLMRKLEANELNLEKLVYSAQATQSVELAENTLGFFTKISDLIMSILDPLGLFDMISTSINAQTSAMIDAERYVITSTASNIGSTVADSTAGLRNTFANTVGGATAAIQAAETKSTDMMALAIANSGVSESFEEMMIDYSLATRNAQAVAAENQAESNAISYAAMEQQARNSSEYRQQQQAAQEQDAKYEEEKAAAREEQRRIEDESLEREKGNYENIAYISSYIADLDMSEYLEPILEEHRTHTEQIKDLQKQTGEIVKLISTVLEYSMVTNPEFESSLSYDERSRIIDNGYVSNYLSGHF